ncbi:hypothetical protein PGT21_006811 [Puccinia graminis f. sp. tritici]|uniref:Mitochondrial import inner membrane translocase subunit TIM22 n=1 Tax=Puccinia graminis f. sp. tritici TaxID=56615 RepID=A0A5B0QFB2_PUCGR|nr:hypothetical protein PGT21_006665 [Puccinia graminis f. sp. tritici]KAA1111633.1 hypothetical protein PGT21_006811 [Puccinia graminis f. sp. tritici]KAA1123885.1 hypothetical protein PGTUg99_028524 [Puccinia graminis f. sp. tritici]
MTTSSSLVQIPSLSYQEIMIPTSCAMMIGFASGATTSGKLAAYQFMVENLHRLPQTRANWFFFQKTKNYKVILGGFKGGLRTGAKLGAWTAGFCTLKEAFTLVPAIERRKSLAGALSGLNIALGASLFYRLRPTISPQRLLLGTLMGLCAGLAEDYKTHLEEDSSV